MIDDGSPKTISEFPMAETDLGLALEKYTLGIMRSMQICFPACIYSYDRNTHTAEVMPLVKQAFYNGTWNYIRRKPFRVSVRNIQCGGFTIDIPVYVGDTGWVFSSDRDTLLVKQDGALTNSVLAGNRPIAIVEDDYQQKPNQPILHDFSRGFFIPDNWGAWQHHRYKDFPGQQVGNALYIGSSFDTNDNREDTPEKKYQKGEDYEKKNSCSIALDASAGSITLGASSDVETNMNAHVQIDRTRVEIEANDPTNKCSSSFSIDAQDGIAFHQDVEGTEQHIVGSIQPGNLLLRLIDGDNMVSFSFANGQLNVSTSSSMNMRVGGDTSFRCSGNVHVAAKGDMNVHADGSINVKTEKDARVSADNARVVVKSDATVTARNASVAAVGNAHVNAGGNVNIGAVKTTNINAGQNVNLAAGNGINVTAPDQVNIVTANNITVMAKKKSSKILVTTLSKDSTIDVVSEGKGSKMNVTFLRKDAAVNLTMKEENSSVNIVTEKENSPISVATNGAKSDIRLLAAKSGIEVDAQSDVKVSSKKNVSVSAQGDVAVNAQGDVSVASSKTSTISGTQVNINGETRINGKVVTPDMHMLGEEQIPYWRHD